MVSELQRNVAIVETDAVGYDGLIRAELIPISDYAGFAGTKDGYYLALNISGTSGTTVTVQTIGGGIDSETKTVSNNFNGNSTNVALRIAGLNEPHHDREQIIVTMTKVVDGVTYTETKKYLFGNTLTLLEEPASFTVEPSDDSDYIYELPVSSYQDNVSIAEPAPGDTSGTLPVSGTLYPLAQLIDDEAPDEWLLHGYYLALKVTADEGSVSTIIVKDNYGDQIGDPIEITGTQDVAIKVSELDATNRAYYIDIRNVASGHAPAYTYLYLDNNHMTFEPFKDLPK